MEIVVACFFSKWLFGENIAMFPEIHCDVFFKTPRCFYGSENTCIEGR